MSWTTFLDHLLDGADGLVRWFPYLDNEAVRRLRGDRMLFVTYLAETHDLTIEEASEALDDWLALAKPNAYPAAA